VEAAARAWRKASTTVNSKRGFVVVFNPMAGRRKAHEVLRRVTTQLDGKIASIVETSLDGAFAPRVRESVRHVFGETGDRPTLVTVGGDGTLSMALNALQNADDATFAVVPAGSGNDFAAAIGCETIDAALDAIERHAERAVDFGIVNGRRFANCVGMGLDAEVGAIAARLRKRGYPPSPSYYAAALLGLFQVESVGVSIECSGAPSRFERGVMVTVGNGPSYGGGFRGAPDAKVDDGVFDAYVFSNIDGFFPRLKLMQLIRAGRHPGEANVTAIRANSIKVSFDRDVALHVDGELATIRSADITVVPRGMHVFAM
jgi:diacylglycerol kinase (ATP)